MKLAQMKLIGIAILATSLSAGGVVAVSYAGGQSPDETRNADGVDVNAAKPADQADTRSITLPTQVSPSAEQRLKSLEAKLDDLLGRINPSRDHATSTTSNAIDPFSRDPGSTKPDNHVRKMADPQNRSIQELEAELKLALADDAQTAKLSRLAAISTSERERARGKVLVVKARLEGLDDELSDEIDRAKLEIATKGKEREKANALTEVASSVVARNTRLNTRKTGMVSEEDVAKAEWEMKAAAAQFAMVEAEIAEIELRVRQLERRRTRIKQIIKPAGE